MFPYELADHLATHLARKILIDGDKSLSVYDPKDPSQGLGKPLWDNESILEMKRKILGEIMENEDVKPKSELEQLKDQVAELNKKFGLNRLIDNSTDYKDKGQILEELKKLGANPDPRKSREHLLTELDNLKNQAKNEPAEPVVIKPIIIDKVSENKT